MPNDELLCIIRGCNVLRLNKFDYTKQPLSGKIRKTSVFAYNPERVYDTPDSTPDERLEENPAKEEREGKPAAKTKKLYGSAKPPSEF